MAIKNILTEDSPYLYDICVIGSGAASMTLVNELSDSGKTICVIESGLDMPCEDAGRLREVENLGEIHVKLESRERIVGGATSTWKGGGAILDKIDFDYRAYLTHPVGWPISFSELIPYYKRVSKYGFAEFDQLDSADPKELKKTGDLRFILTELIEKTFIASLTPWNFGDKLRSVFEKENIDLYINATALNLYVTQDAAGKALVTHVNIRTLEGEKRKISAKVFVVAAGALESARLLLLSDNLVWNGLGNENDQVGRYLMNHPKQDFGYIHLNQPINKLPYFFGYKSRGFKYFAGLRVNEDIQRSLGILNSYVRFEPYYDYSANRVVRLFEKVFYKLGFRPIKKIQLRNFMEMEPRPENRITLSNIYDRNGQRKAAITMNTTELDRKSLCELHRILENELNRSGLGRLESHLENENPWPINFDASHHLGGTRMGLDPKTSVVNSDLKVHGVDNVYISSGSVFPTSGSAHPTYTICALSARLADRLRN